MRRRAVILSLVAAVLSSSSIRAGSPIFTDATAESGIEFRNLCGAKDPRDKSWITDSLGAGAAWLDFNGDGHLDLYLINGSAHGRKQGEGEANRLFAGDGQGRFRDVTSTAGVGDRSWGVGVAVGDVDNDGDPDLYVTNHGPNILYLNKGDGTFQDVTGTSGVGDPGWGTSAAFFDMDGDGDLDLYLGNYIVFDAASIPRRGTPEARAIPTCIFRGIPVFCGPNALEPAQNVLYRNNGDGSFTDASAAAGIQLARPRFTLGVVTADYDNDGDQDIYVANDSVANSLWRNNGDGTFKEVGVSTLSALDSDGHAQAGMGTAFADFDEDGWLDLVVTNFSHDLNTLYRNVGGRYFMDESSARGMAATSLSLSWGTGFRDLDQDGDLDLFIANGHVYPEVDKAGMGTHYKQNNHLFVQREGRFHEESSTSGTALRVVRSFRAAAFADYDEDGDQDILVTAMDDQPLLMRNETPSPGNWLQVALTGTRSNRDAVGARVRVTVSGRTMIRERQGGGSYLAASDSQLHFGLGEAERAALVEVLWPSGQESRLQDVPANQVLRITEPEPDP